MRIFFENKHARIILFLAENYTIETDIIRYYLLANYQIQKLWEWEYDYVCIHATPTPWTGCDTRSIFQRNNLVLIQALQPSLSYMG